MACRVVSKPVRAWEIIRLTAWTLVFTTRSAADLFDPLDDER